MPTLTFAPLLHLLGFLIGAALYALLLALVARKFDYLALLTAVLGLSWNVIGLADFVIRDFAGRDSSAWLVATAYSALGFLPAVVVHSVLRGRDTAATRIVIAAAYVVSTSAETLMYWSARFGEAPSAPALRLLTWSYAALTIPVLVLTRRRGNWSIVALAVFAISALHLSRAEAPQQSIVMELIGHHASIPLIFAILYQDFRFALADQFLKRALALFAVISIAAALYFGVAIPIFQRHDYRTDAVGIGIVLILWVGTATLYPLIARGASWFVDRVVLRRADYGELLERVAREIAAAGSEEEVLGAACAAAQTALSAESVHWAEDDGREPRFIIGALRSGRSLLSGDHQLLSAIAALAARRIDALRLARERHEMHKLTTEAELRALRAQVNPHFLFNALNTIGYLIQTAPARASTTLMKLTSLLRAVLRSGGTAVRLGDEIDLIAAYLDIERARFEERLEIDIDVPEPLRGVQVPPLVLQPLVENAIKHGIANSRGGGAVGVRVRAEGDLLVITVRNTGATTSEMAIAHGRRRGMGLANLDARLRHLYGEAARLTLIAAAEETRAEVALPVLARDAA